MNCFTQRVFNVFNLLVCLFWWEEDLWSHTLSSCWLFGPILLNTFLLENIVQSERISHMLLILIIWCDDGGCILAPPSAVDTESSGWPGRSEKHSFYSSVVMGMTLISLRGVRSFFGQDPRLFSGWKHAGDVNTDCFCLLLSEKIYSNSWSHTTISKSECLSHIGSIFLWLNVLYCDRIWKSDFGEITHYTTHKEHKHLNDLF